MKIRIDEIRADIEAADFSTLAAAEAFRAKMCSDYSARELIVCKGFLSGWRFTTNGERQLFVRMWDHLIQEARSLIVQVRTLGGGAIKNRLVRGANGVMLPHPQMLDDLDDGLYDMTIKALRRMAARAMENNATVQDVARKAEEYHKENMGAHEATHARLPKKSGANKGGKRNKRTKISGAWITAKEVADEFTKAFNHGKGFTPKGGKRRLGILTENTVNNWDSKHPDYQHKNKWGYYAQLRIDSSLKKDYFEVIGNWVCYYERYRQWDKQHPGVKYRPIKRTDIDTARIGKDKHGDLVMEPKPDQCRT